MGRRHIVFYSANYWHFVAAVINEKVNIDLVFILRRASILYDLHQRDTYAKALLYGQQAFSSLLAFFNFVKFVNYSCLVPTFYKESFWAIFGFLLHYGATYTHICFTNMQHYYLQKHVLWDKSTRTISTNKSMDQIYSWSVCKYCAAFLTREG